MTCGEFECLPSDAVWTNSMAYVMLEKTRPRGRRDDPRQVEVAVDPVLVGLMALETLLGSVRKCG